MKPLIFLALFSSFLTACGYHMRGETRPFFEKHQIQTLYIYPVKNNSYKAGVEITVYNALRKRFSQGGYIRLVDEPQYADGLMLATVAEAIYSPMGTTKAENVATAGVPKAPGTVQIASSYNVNLSVGFMLQTKNKVLLWADTIGRSKSFAASNYIGTLGSTSALINEGEFERTLNDLSVGIVTDAEESINTIF